LTEKSSFNTFLCGLVAGGAEALFVVTPQETLKTKLIHDKMSDKPKYRNIYTIGKSQGAGGMYKGVIATFIKQSSNQGIRFVVFEETQRTL
jgi:solute carrier family 25 citrate transporter 1